LFRQFKKQIKTYEFLIIIIMFSKSKLQEKVFRIRDKIGLLEAPISVQWMATYKCNLKCKHCMVNAGKPVTNELSTDEIKTFIEDISKMGVKTFFVTGGEPLVRKDIFEVMSYAHKKGLKTGMATNGLLINKYKDEIQSLNLSAIMVSLDGLKESHKKIRGSNINYEELLESIRFLKTINIPKVGICTTVNKFNFDELESLKKLILSLQINEWRINIILPRGRAKIQGDKLLLNQEEQKRLFKFIFNNKKLIKFSLCSEMGYFGKWNKKLRGNSYFFCSCGWTSCTLMANGDIMACPIYEKNNFIEDNIRQNSFKAIWENGLNKFRNLPLNEKCSHCKYLHNCNGGCKVMRILDVNCVTERIDNIKTN
jgi:AdoMet-dependent heme synthase